MKRAEIVCWYFKLCNKLPQLCYKSMALKHNWAWLLQELNRLQCAFAYLFAKVARQQSFLLSGKPTRGIYGIVSFSDSNVVWGWGQGIQVIQWDPTVTGAVVNHFRVWVWCHLLLMTTRCDDILTILIDDDFITSGGEAMVYQEWLGVVNGQLCRDIKTYTSQYKSFPAF